MAAAGEKAGGSAVEESLAASRVVDTEVGDLVLAAAAVRVQVMEAAPAATMAGGQVVMREAARAEATW
jgi:hypothetical protein